ncbi:MAG TPA: hypothetical protein VFI73_02025 [Candidatus Nitrosopolaris sp.]|nr:hypothetical protein [Candidatus Nitrosopolaris sp.]
MTTRKLIRNATLTYPRYHSSGEPIVLTILDSCRCITKTSPVMNIRSYNPQGGVEGEAKLRNGRRGRRISRINSLSSQFFNIV